MSRRSREDANSSGKKRIHRIEHKNLLAHFSDTGAENDTFSPQSASPRSAQSPAQSPASHNNLSYYQQALLHQQQVQKTVNLQRLTADLVGIQFNDEDVTLKSSPKAIRTTARSAAKQQVANRVSSPRTDNSKSSKTIKTNRHQDEADQSKPDPGTSGGYEEQMVSSSGSGGEIDPAKDAKETADDAAALKRFKIINLVGTGNYARVYRGSSSYGREVAIKVINLVKTSENYRQKFLPRELNILKKIQHFNICKTHEIISVENRIFIIMQFCSRGTIADLLHKIGPLSEPVTRFLFGQTLEAVNYMHSIDLAHRDLKVENILLDSEFSPKLTDFSYSIFNSQDKINSNKSGTKTKNSRVIKLNETFCGTLPYLSPEMIRQNPYDSKKTDIWSLGICLYVMLNDRLPFPFSNIKSMVKKQLTKDYKFKTHIEFSEQIKDLVGQMLEPDFRKRFTCNEIIQHIWLNGPRERPVG